ncbi:hypothetical protein [Succinimonas sp.]|uniref:restriction system modified-DNA reader domain-containing protein n=1 Tax=Succinimonas sp. TaxID=1936151 RepID=UPI0038708195
MYLLSDNHEIKDIEETTFSEIGYKECHLEELIRKNINIICDDDESIFIVGQQVTNEKKARSDLTAIDNEGNLVLIEIKRDKIDIEHRKEPLEFQAIRYAASCATIDSIDKLVTYVFQPYVEKHKIEFSNDSGKHPNFTEIALQRIKDFLNENEIDQKKFNRSQRIILIASEFDEQTLSAVAWLNNNNVKISCFEIKPYKTHDEKIILDVKKVLPISEYSDFYIPIQNQLIGGNASKSSIKRKKRLNIDDLLRLNLIEPNTVLIDTRMGKKATLQSDGDVKIYDTGEIQSIQNWLKSIYNWASVQSFKFLKVEKTNKLLLDIRDEYYKSMNNAQNQD